MFSPTHTISLLQDETAQLMARREWAADPEVIETFNRQIRRNEERISDLLNLGRDDSEPDVTIDPDDYSTIVTDSREPEQWTELTYGVYSERITRWAAAKKLNVWRAVKGKYAGSMMCGRVRIIPASEHNGNLPAAMCTHCGWAASPAGTTRDHFENFTILVIAHGHNDGPAYARRYTIAEQSCYERGTTIAMRNAARRVAALRELHLLSVAS